MVFRNDKSFVENLNPRQGSAPAGGSPTAEAGGRAVVRRDGGLAGRSMS